MWVLMNKLFHICGMNIPYSVERTLHILWKSLAIRYGTFNLSASET